MAYHETPHTQDLWSSASSATVQTGYKPHHPTPPNVDRHQPASSRAHARSGTEALVGARLTGATSANATRPRPNHALAGRADLQDGHPTRTRLGQGGPRVWHPVDLPPGLPRGTPGAEPPEAAAGRVEDCPRGAAWSGYARPTGCPTAPSAQDHPWSSDSRKHHDLQHATTRADTTEARRDQAVPRPSDVKLCRDATGHNEHKPAAHNRLTARPPQGHPPGYEKSSFLRLTYGHSQKQ